MWSTGVGHNCANKKEKSTSLTANSLLPPQHRHRHHHRPEEAPLSHLPLSNPSSLKEAGEQRSPKKCSGHQISRPPYKGMIPKPDSLPSSLGRRIVAQASSASRSPRRRPRTTSGPLPPRTTPGYLGPCTTCLWP